MAKSMKISAETRVEQGTSVVKRMRRTGWIPGIVYGEGGVAKIRLNARDFATAMRAHEGEHRIMDLEVAGQGVRKVLLQEIQHDPVMHHPIHVDFHEVSMTKRIRIKVPLRLVGEPVGVVTFGGVLQHLVREAELECLPSDIPEHVDVDVSALGIGDSLTFADVKMDEKKYRLVSGRSVAVVSVTAPREEEAEVVPAEGAAAEPEVLREKKPEEGEEGAEAGKEGAKPAAGGKEAGAKPAAGGKEAAGKPAAGGKDAAAKPAGKESKK
jgi:large subunit ribosomal protein L25